jgi:hypothetical protein
MVFPGAACFALAPWLPSGRAFDATRAAFYSAFGATCAAVLQLSRKYLSLEELLND